MKVLRHVLSCSMMVLLLIVTSCGSPSSTSKTGNVVLKVFAASSLTESFNAIKADYQAMHPTVTITYNFNGSQALEQQMANGADADIFASADQINMHKAQDANLVTSSQVFAKNRLVVIVPITNPGKITTLKDLARSGLKLIVGAPSVPIGKYGLQVLDKLGKSSAYGPQYEKSVKANIISQEENVKAVVQKVQLGEADAGIVYLTDVTASVSGKVKVVSIADQYNVIATYPIAVTKGTTHSKEAQDFVNYLLSPAGQSILAKYHFLSI